MPIASDDSRCGPIDSDSQPCPKAYAILHDDPFYKYWRRGHYDKATTLIENAGLDWTSIVVVRYGSKQSELDNPICVLITVKEESPEELLDDAYKLQLQSAISKALWPASVCRVFRGITYIAHDLAHTDHYEFVVEIVKGDAKRQTKVYTGRRILWCAP